MREKDLKVFIGPADVTNIAANLGDALRKRGVKVTTVNIGSHCYLAGKTYDEVLSPPSVKNRSNYLVALMRYAYWARIFIRFFIRDNRFIFLSGKTLMIKNYDLPLYRLFRKKTIMWFLGSEIKDLKKREEDLKRRGIEVFRNEKVGEDTAEKRQEKLRLIRTVEKNVDAIITAPSIAQLIRRDYYGKRMETRVFLPIDVESIRFHINTGGGVSIVHAPSNMQIKGTDSIVESLDRLRSEGYAFQLTLTQNMPNNELRELLSNSDIVVDQLYAFGPGMLALEAMCAGCAVLGGNIPEVSYYPDDLPIIHTNPGNIYMNLKMLLDDAELRRDLAVKGRRYVEKYHSHYIVADKILSILTRGADGATAVARR
jgi:hypothetical protein